MSDSPNVPADWYEDPEDATQFRYWDGAQWTDHRAPRYTDAVATPAAEPVARVAEPIVPVVPEPAAATPVYGAPPAYGAPPVPAAPGSPAVADRPIATGPLLAAGGLLILAGLGRAVSYFLPFELYGLSLVFGALEVIGWAGAFLAFVLAGFPSRSTASRALALVLVGIYVVTGAITIALSADPYSAGRVLAGVVGFFGFLTLGVGIAFGVITARTKAIAPRLRMVPLGTYLGLLVFGFFAGVVNAAVSTGAGIPWQAGIVIGGLSGLIPIAAGVAFLLFGRTPYATSVSYPVAAQPAAATTPAPPA